MIHIALTLSLRSTKLFSQRQSDPGVGEEIELEDTAAELFAEAQVRAREQAAYEQLKASGMCLHCTAQYRMIIQLVSLTS